MDGVHQKTQVLWGVDLFHKFILFAQKRGNLTEENIDQELKALLKLVKKDEEPEVIVDALNMAIKKVNALMKENSEYFLKYAPFPNFSFVSKEHERSAVLDQLDMFQRTLSEAADADVLDFEKEGACFTNILALFIQVEEGKIEYQDAMALLADEIEKINRSLPKKYKLPLIDLMAYK